MKVSKIIWFLIPLIMIILINASFSAQDLNDNDDYKAFNSRARVLRKMHPALDKLEEIADNAPLPPAIEKLLGIVIGKTKELLETDTKVYDQSWKDYHTELADLYHLLRKEGADTQILANVRILKDASSIDGFLVTLLGISTVFAGLLILASIFAIIPKLINKKAIKAEDSSFEPKFETALTGEVISAISTALYMHLNVYQEEQKQILTWDKRFRRFSPWNMSGRLAINQKDRQI